ncbi:MAG: tRNA lysidine(34) synthetase TilS [Deltaproteobacteria bacterium]|nr:tRNA lysidine(34) synthetase TilS [Deltaproteobacteria bacterium]
MRHRLATLVGVVQATLRRHAMVRRGERVLVAVSGGADSVGLLLVLATLRRRLGIELVAAHVNHRLRGAEADADEACAAAAAQALAVPFVRADLGRRLAAVANLEARARALRYAALHRLADANGCTRIATGHTRDDQAETVLMRLIRGSGGRGLAGVRPRRRDGVIRPLIDCRRAALARAAGEAGLAVRIDASNADPRFLRTHVRHRVLPLLAELNPAIVEACGKLADAARAEARIVRLWADAALAALPPGDVLPVEALRAHPPGVRGVLLRRWLRQRGVATRRLGARHLAAVVGLLEPGRGVRRVSLPGGEVGLRRGLLSVTIAPARPAIAAARRRSCSSVRR